jgi:glycerophosphoryl diester phosphodiesterase
MKTNLLSLLIFISGMISAQKALSLSRFPDDKVMVVAHRAD